MKYFTTITLILAATTCTAEQLTISKTYGFYQLSYKLRDAACLQAFETHIVPTFDGLTGLELASPDFFEFSNGPVGVYSETLFISEYGDTSGVLICAYASDWSQVTDIAASFEGLGLDGRKIRSFEPSAADGRKVRRISGLSQQINP